MMEKRWVGKTLLLLASVVVSGLYLYPTLSGMDVEKSRFPIKQKINLGLDLQGGLYMVLGVDFSQIYREVMDRQSSSFRDRMKEKGVPATGVQAIREGFPAEDPRFEVTFDSNRTEEVRKFFKDEFSSLRLTEEKAGKFQFGLAHAYRTDVRDKTIGQSIEVIRNRIDEFGVAEPSITSQGTDRIVVELPGVKEVDRAKKLIGQTARLEFKLVNDKAMGPQELAVLIEKIEKENNLIYKETDAFSKYITRLNDLAKGKIPADSMITFERVKGATGEVVRREPFLLFSKTEVSGDELMDAQVGINQETQAPEVNFQFNPRGGVLFGELTGKHIRERIAIVLDNLVVSAPVVNSKITDRGVITLGSGNAGDQMKEAKDLALVLRAGALPAQLSFLEQRVMGPSLGADSIRLGTTASLIGAVLVFFLVAVYYRASGVIAVISLILNVMLVLAILVGLEATLTLPGIAGIALTVGIAVDSNVVIYERIREELRSGKRIHGAVEAGFQKAFRTIVDANVTNAAAAVVLLNFGTGPIKGFAVTLLIGIVTTVFTAVFVCRVLFDFYIKRLESKPGATLSI